MPYVLRWECVYGSRHSEEANGVSEGCTEEMGSDRRRVGSFRS